MRRLDLDSQDSPDIQHDIQETDCGENAHKSPQQSQ